MRYVARNSSGYGKNQDDGEKKSIGVKGKGGTIRSGKGKSFRMGKTGPEGEQIESSRKRKI